MDKEFNIETHVKDANKGLEPQDEGRPINPAVMHVQNVEPRTFHVEDAVRMKRTSRLRALLDFNKMKEPIVYGILTEKKASNNTLTMSSSIPFWLNEIHTIDGNPLEIPLIGSHNSPRIPLNVRPQNANIGDRIKIRINVVEDHTREIDINGKPFALIGTGPAEVLRLVPIPVIVRDGSKILIEKSIWDSEREKLESPLKISFEKFKGDMERERQSILNTNNVAEQESVQKREAIIEMDKKVTDSTNQFKAIEANLALVHEQITKTNKQREETMAAYQEMCDFARDRAGILKTLDLISNEQLTQLTGGNDESVPDTDQLSWKNDLNQEYGKAVSTIHAYLLDQGMIYPRWLIADFLTLLRMNDLIILSGLSGAGKTQIVRSFAQALGGVAHIIPVKPNWTGAEDLLGFFNPLQRSYVRTPFLEALLAARSDPSRLHFICLDEMNLARAEYYFADFLSAQEDRSKLAEISLYSESEASHIQAEVRMLLAALRGLGSGKNKDDNTSLNIEELIQRPEYMERLRSMFGENAGESFPVFHGRIRRSLSTVLDVPSKIVVSANVRFIGSINVDQTTYGLSPKILDRAHVIRFDNPLKYSFNDIREDAKNHMSEVTSIAPIHMHPDAFLPMRNDYPQYDEKHPAAKWLLELYSNYLADLGIDVAFRTIRQAQLFWDLHAEVSEGSKDQQEADAKNLIFLQKILPKFTMDGKTKIRFRNESEPKMRAEIVTMLEKDLKATAESTKIHPNMHEELHRVRVASESSDKIFNYWA